MTDAVLVELYEVTFGVLEPADDTVTVVASDSFGMSTSGGGGGAALTVKEEGSAVDTAVESINFVGGSQTAAQTASGAVTVTSTAYYPGGTDVPVTDGGTGASDASTARTNLGLGSIATQASSSVSITGGSITGITDLAIADGGTGSSTAAAARTALGVVQTFAATGGDDTAALQAVLDAYSAVRITGTVLVSSTIKLNEGQELFGDSHRTSIIKLANGSNLTGPIICSKNYTAHTGVSNPLHVHDIGVDGNKANNTGSADGILIFAWLTTVEDCHVYNCTGNGIVYTDADDAGTFIATSGQNVENRIRNNRVQTCDARGIYVWEQSGDGNLTDGFCENNIVNSCALDGILIQRGAGWHVIGNHTYTGTGLGTMGIRVQRCFSTRITDNYVDNYGQSATTGFYSGIRAEIHDVRGSVIANNTISCTEDTAGSTYRHLYVLASTSITTARAVVAGNVIVGNAATNGTGIRIEAGSGTNLSCHVFGNKVDNCNTSFTGVATGTLSGRFDLYGSGSPESNITAPIGATWTRSDGSTSTTLYVKESGTGNTGWVAVGSGGVTSVDGNTGAVTALQLLTSIKTVDGSGSGLDADLLDGQSSAYYATATSVTDHTGDTSDAHDASAISIVDSGAYYTGTDVEAALQEAGLTLSALGDVTTLKKLTSGMTVPINSLDRWKAGPGMPGTKLNGAISSTSATSITVDNASFTPDNTSRHVTIDDEEIAITAGFGTTGLTIARGINGTTAATHSDRAPVLHRKMRRVLLWGDSITGGYIPDYGDGFALRAARVLGANGGGEQGQLFPYWLNSTATPSAPDWAVTGTLSNSTAGISYDVGLQGSVILSSGTGNYLTLSRRSGTRWACIDVPWVDYSSTAQNWSYSVDGGSTWTNNPITTSIWSSGRGILRRSRIVVDNPDSFIIRGANAAGTGATIVLPYSGVTVWPSVPVNGTTVGQQWLNAGYGGMRLRIALNSRTVTDGVVTNGSPTVTSATAVFATNYDAGSTIYIEGVAYTISTRDSATQITLTGNYAGSSGTGKRLTIFAGDNTGDRLGSIFGHHGSWVPDLIVCGTWINDIVNSGASHDTSKGDENPDAMTDMLQYVYTKCSDFADLLFVASYEFATTAATSGLQLQYRTNVETVAANNNAACLNLYDAFDAYGVTGYSAMNSAGYMYDSVHLSAKGNRWIGSHFARALGVI